MRNTFCSKSTDCASFPRRVGLLAVNDAFRYSTTMTIGVYGLGRFGYFWAALLQKQGHTVYGYGRTATAVPDGVSSATEDEVLACDVIFFCVTISAFKTVLEHVAPRIKSGALVMDTCSVKTYPAKIMEAILPHDVSCIATHPMFGPDSGKNGIEGLPLVFCPIRCNDELSSYWHSEFLAWGLDVVTMSADEHDREAAYSQGITHFVGRTLDELNLKPTRLATVDYRSLMTIVEQTCNDPKQLFYDLQRYNPYARTMRLELMEALAEVMGELAAQEKTEL